MLILVPFVLAACTLGPGLLLVRHLAARPLERLLVAVGASLLLAFLGAFAIYVSGLPKPAYWLVPALGLACAAGAWAELRLLLRDAEVRAALTGYGFLALWCVALLALIRNYGGANWCGDWLEHYARSVFFLQHEPLETLIAPAGGQLTARPPLFNVLVVLVLACTEQSFPAFQLTASLLNTLLYLPVVAFALRFANAAGRGAGTRQEPAGSARHAQRLSALVLLAMMANPFVVVNATYSWTKLLAALFILIAVYFYWRGLDTGAFADSLVSFGALAAGLLTHYSTGPYIVILVAHFLSCVLWKQPRPLRRLLGIVALCGPLLASWVAWAVFQFGAANTFGSNTSVVDAKAFTFAENVLKILRNIVATIVPHPLRGAYSFYDQPNTLGDARDYFFLINQTNVLFMLGSTAWICCFISLRRAWSSPPTRGASRRHFWLGFALSALVLGVAVVGSSEYFGLGHICLHALVPLGFAHLAQAFTSLSWWQRLLLGVGLLLDLEFISLHFYLQHLSWASNSPGYGLNPIVHREFLVKERFGVEFLGDRLAHVDGLLVAVLCAIGLAAVLWAIRGWSASPGRVPELNSATT